MQLTITEEHVKVAIEMRKDDNNTITRCCPTALALNELTGKKHIVGFNRVFDASDQTRAIYNCKGRIHEEIWLFSTCNKFEPGTYELTEVLNGE